MTDYRAWIAAKRAQAWQRGGYREPLYPGAARPHVCTWCDASAWGCEEADAGPDPEPELEQQLELF